MEFKVDVDVRRLVKAYEDAPDATKRQVSLWLKSTAESIKDYASKHHRYTSRTGMLERQGIKWHVNEANSSAIVELDPKVRYGLFIHEGYRPFDIVPRSKQVLRWSDGSSFIFAKKVRHPGWSPDQFLYEAADSIRSSAEKELQERIDLLLRRLEK